MNWIYTVSRQQLLTRGGQQHCRGHLLNSCCNLLHLATSSLFPGIHGQTATWMFSVLPPVYTLMFIFRFSWWAMTELGQWAGPWGAWPLLIMGIWSSSANPYTLWYCSSLYMALTCSTETRKLLHMQYNLSKCTKFCGFECQISREKNMPTPHTREGLKPLPRVCQSSSMLCWCIQ